MNSPPGAIPVQRGCGRRQKGGCYAECGLGPGGRPIEAFLFDPPILVPDGFNVPNRGVLLTERGGVWHIIDRIGNEFYPSPADFVEESLRYGVSRRLPNNIDFSKLTAESRLLLVHDRAWVENCADFAPWRCPKHLEHHAFDQSPPMCAGVWWEDVRDVNALAPGIRHVRRQMPGFDYEARRVPDGVEGQYRQAFFASFPIHRLAVVKGSPKTAAGKAAAQKSTLPVVEVTQ